LPPVVPPVAEKEDNSNLPQDSASLSQALPATTTTETSKENGGSDGEKFCSYWCIEVTLKLALQSYD